MGEKSATSPEDIHSRITKESHEAHRCMLSCSRKGGGSAKNICIRKISKQKYIIKKKEKYYVSLSKKGFTK